MENDALVTADDSFHDDTRAAHAHGYHLPSAHIEHAGIEPIPADQKNVGFIDQFCVFVNFLLNPSVMLHGGAAVAMGLSFQAACLAVGLGTLSALIPYTMITRIGVDYGIPGQVAARMSYGIRGAQLIPSVARAVCSVYFFALNTIIGTIAVHALLFQVTGLDLSLPLIGILFGFLQIIFAVLGYDWLKKMSRLVLPVKLFIIAYFMVLLTHHADPSFRPLAVWHYQGAHAWSWAIIAIWFNTGCSSWLSMITDAADFCRYSRNRRTTYWGVGLASVCGTGIATVFGAYAAASVGGTNGNVFTILSTYYPDHLSLLLIFILLLFDNISINSLNIYTGGLSLENIFPAVKRTTATAVISLLGIALSASQDVVNNLVGYVDAIGSMFAPITGIIIADVIWLRHGRLNVKDLFDRNGPYWFSHGFNVCALISTAGGVLLYYMIPAYFLRPLLVFFISGAFYIVMEKVLTVRSHLAKQG
mgnify:CR=1 FL=1